MKHVASDWQPVARLQEDLRIVQLVSEMGPKKWSVIAQQLPGRIGKQCRERSVNLLHFINVFFFYIFNADEKCFDEQCTHENPSPETTLC